MHDRAESLLAWWTQQGRDGIPWKCLASGERPGPQQELDPYGIWIADVKQAIGGTDLLLSSTKWKKFFLFREKNFS